MSEIATGTELPNSPKGLFKKVEDGVNDGKRRLSHIIEIGRIKRAISKMSGGLDDWGEGLLPDCYLSSLKLIEEKNLNPLKKREKEADLLEIAIEGRFRGKEIVIPPKRWHYRNRISQRIHLMEIYSRNPDFAQAIVLEGIVGGHGSTSGSLLGVLEYGLKSQAFLEEKDVLVATGEGIYGSADLNRDYVGFFGWDLDQDLTHYSVRYSGLIDEDSIRNSIKHLEQTPSRHLYADSRKIKEESLRKVLAFLEKENKSEKEKMLESLIRENFPVIYFIDETTFDRKSDNDVKPTGLGNEFAVRGGVELRGIKAIAVPEEKIKFVSNLINLRGLKIAVFSLDDYSDNSKYRHPVSER